MGSQALVKKESGEFHVRAQLRILAFFGSRSGKNGVALISRLEVPW